MSDPCAYDTTSVTPVGTLPTEFQSGGINVSPLLPGGTPSTYSFPTITYDIANADCKAAGLSVVSHTYTTEFTPPTDFSFGSTVTNSASVPTLSIGKLNTFVPNGEQTYTSTLTIKVSVTVQNSLA